MTKALFQKGVKCCYVTKRERNPAIVQAAKAKFLQVHGKFFCQACGFDLEDFYGDIGHHFLEAHHAVPVSELRENSTTKVSDIALLCSNCHRMLRRRRPWIKMSNLKMLLKPQAATDRPVSHSSSQKTSPHNNPAGYPGVRVIRYPNIDNPARKRLSIALFINEPVPCIILTAVSSRSFMSNLSAPE